MAKTTQQQLADDYGYQLAFLKSDPGLYKVFQQAVDGGWDATRFVAAVRNTTWYKTHSETYRNNSQLKYADPATFNSQLNQKIAELTQKMWAMGAGISNASMKKLATDALMFGYNDQQVTNLLSRSIRPNAVTGTAGDVGVALRQTAYRNGITVSDSLIQNATAQIAQGKQTVEQVQQMLRVKYAAALAPGFKKELAAGMDLYDVASPYMQSMAKILELSPSSVDLFDPTIRKALSGATVDKKGDTTSVPLGEFERQLKSDPRWLKTKNAQDDLMGVTHGILQSLGLSAV